WMEDGREQPDVRQRILRVLARRAAAREERLQRLRCQVDDAVPVDAADPAALHRVSEGMEHAETHYGSVCTTTSAIPGTALRPRSSIALARPGAAGGDPAPPRAR